MRSLNPDHLTALIEVVAQASFTRAARRLNLAQPTISLQVRELEARLGVRLVDRLGKRAFATAAGRELIEHARRIGEANARLLAAMRRHREGWLGQVRIGSSTTALIYHLPPVLQELRRSQPNIELLVTTGTTNGIVDRILRNDVDLGVVSLPVNDRLLDVEPLLEEPLVAIFAAGVRGLPARITPPYLLGHPLLLEFARAHVRALIVDWLSSAGVEARPAMELDNLEAVKRMVAAGLGASIVPLAAVSKENARHDLVARPLRPALQRTLALIQRRDKIDDTALKRVREALLALRR
ncbi:MAG TPA: LysR family transcriptional regulator [Hyphomicrobiaceae bacterium]|nr:LysR family transcriptional regulator [Hyphomicrobiaceae bacterium]